MKEFINQLQKVPTNESPRKWEKEDKKEINASMTLQKQRLQKQTYAVIPGTDYRKL